ncbi:MAG: zinc ribbon domain-containing protein [Clostridia bacterium]|nr:zinc ribbon domain-containing protein [Clostridia bacterium]
MEFFEDALNKTKEVFGTVSQKTGEVIATEKQRFELATVKSKREKDYKALGKIYYGIIKDDASAPEAAKALAESITAKNAEIERLNAEIANAKYKRVCENCGASIDKNSVFCNFCGAKLDNDGE